MMAFSPSSVLPNSPPQKKTPKFFKQAGRNPCEGGLARSQSAFQLSSSLPQNNQLSKRKLCKNHPTQLKFWEKHHPPSKWHLQFKGILRLLQHPDDPDAFARPKEKFFELNKYFWGLSKFLTRFVEAMLNSSQDRLLQMSSYVAILETAKGCYSKCMSLDAIRYGWQLANGAERAKKSQNFTEKNTDNSAVTICSYPTCQSAAVRQN